MDKQDWIDNAMREAHNQIRHHHMEQAHKIEMQLLNGEKPTFPPLQGDTDNLDFSRLGSFEDQKNRTRDFFRDIGNDVKNIRDENMTLSLTGLTKKDIDEVLK